MRLLQSLKQTEINGNPAQLRAIEHGDGAACVIAGPGSGKTFVIIKRIIRLIEKGVKPGEILVISFTKAAAIEMQQRFIKETDSMYPEVLFGTFHSIFYQIIKAGMTNYSEPVTIMRETDKYIFMCQVLKVLKSRLKEQKKTDHKIDLPEISFDKDTVKALIAEISRIKNDGNKPELCDESVPLREYFTDIFEDYTSIMRSRNMIDFEDMVLICHELLRKNRGLLSLYRNAFRYILIDEYQDINKMQFEVIRLLSGDNSNLFVVGDDDQSIYGFRGSKPEFMLDFKKYFPGAKEILLDRNYRCGKDILDASLKVINENTDRFKKDIKSGLSGKNGKVNGLVFENKEEQYEFIYESLKNKTFSECAVIFRTNLEATSLAKFLISKNIPCYYKEKIELFQDRKAVKEVLSYLKFAYKTGLREDFLVLMNNPLRFIERDSVKNEMVREEDLLKYYSSKGNLYMLGVIQKLFKDIRMIQGLRPYLAIHYIRKVVGFDKFLKEKYSHDKKTLEESLGNLDKLMEICRGFKDKEALWEYLESENRLKEEVKVTAKTAKDGVRLMTMHASKGLEFRYVYLPDLNEGIIPSRKSITAQAIEEERRMLYVAMTRAKDELTMSFIKGTENNPMRMSGFLRPIRNLFSENYENKIQA